MLTTEVGVEAASGFMCEALRRLVAAEGCRWRTELHLSVRGRQRVELQVCERMCMCGVGLDVVGRSRRQWLEMQLATRLLAETGGGGWSIIILQESVSGGRCCWLPQVLMEDFWFQLSNRISRWRKLQVSVRGSRWKLRSQQPVLFILRKITLSFVSLEKSSWLSSTFSPFCHISRHWDDLRGSSVVCCLSVCSATAHQQHSVHLWRD